MLAGVVKSNKAARVALQKMFSKTGEFCRRFRGRRTIEYYNSRLCPTCAYNVVKSSFVRQTSHDTLVDFRM